MHPLTLTHTISSLLSSVPRKHHPHDSHRMRPRGKILRLRSEMVSQPELRTALGLVLAAQSRGLELSPEAMRSLLTKLVEQREWVVVALIYVGMVDERRKAREAGSWTTNPPYWLLPHLCTGIARVLNNCSKRILPVLALQALQALAILGGQIDARSIPSADVSGWVEAVGGIGTRLATVQVRVSGTDDHVSTQARAYLKDVLTRYAESLPRTRHIFSVGNGKGARVRRGGQWLEEGKRPILSDADDGAMPPPDIKTYEALFNVLLTPGEVYSSGKKEAVNSVEGNWHAASSPNSPTQEMHYPGHVLDFPEYPAQAPEDEERPYELACRVLRHMMHERMPPLVPWVSPTLLELLRKHKEGLGDLWDTVEEGAGRLKVWTAPVLDEQAEIDRLNRQLATREGKYDELQN
ncbi:hypothetical protein FB45DRAFT_1021171 [Roridomyces roridus]|uniref:Uncharacterized protein n=1 Tax=Roridomyces roridus TaxID=1738132 RepID=A0AAD7FY87_9AGAR|nr:hypothetical protein FB45DRAFT_1021171 [Roridomyces roridus]